jgi:flagellar biosynthesis chaperone FliJ
LSKINGYLTQINKGWTVGYVAHRWDTMQTFMESRNLAVEKMLNKALEVVEII